MGLAGIIVVFGITWWVVFIAVLPLGVERQDHVEPGHDPGAPKRPMIWRKAAIATVVTVIIVGTVWFTDDRGWIDYRGLILGTTSR